MAYLDTARSTILQSDTYRIRAKPDKLVAIGNDQYAYTEYKHRAGGLYPSDRVQMIATTLAARESGFDIRQGYLETSTGKRFNVRLSQDSPVLFAQIAQTVNQAALAVSGEEPVATPSQAKCRSCTYRAHCPFSHH